MASLSKRVLRALPDPIWALIQHVPVVTTRSRVLRRLDAEHTAGWLAGNRAARDEIERLDEAADRAVADFRTRIERGPQPARTTSTGHTLRLVG